MDNLIPTRSTMNIPPRSPSSFYEVHADGRLRSLPSREATLEAHQQGSCVWLDLTDPTKEELQDLIQPLGLHPLAIEDCFDEEQIPKVEDYPTNTFMLFNRYSRENMEWKIDEVDLFLGERFLVSVGLQPEEDPRYAQRLEEAINLDPNVKHQSADFLLHVILDFIVDGKWRVIEELQEQIDRAEEEILNEPSGFTPETLMHLRRNLLGLRKSLFHEREILVKICRRDSPYVTDKAIYHFRDIYDHLAKFCEVIEMYRETISSLMELYFSTQNNRMTKTANRTNRVVRRLTFITTIFMPLSLLAGIGGMSEWSMMTGPQNWRIAYSSFLALMVILGIASYFLLKKIESRDRNSED
jgi:magnesium transporter